VARYRCKDCGYNITATKPRGKPAALKALALPLHWQGADFPHRAGQRNLRHFLARFRRRTKVVSKWRA
jgi:hypothetical protein